MIAVADKINTTSVEEGDHGFDLTFLGFDNQDDTMTAILSPHDGVGPTAEIVAHPKKPHVCHYKDAPDAWKHWIYLNFFIFFLLPILVSVKFIWSDGI